jgi:parvulin-like peptidyl-prolyl isomerase
MSTLRRVVVISSAAAFLLAPAFGQTLQSSHSPSPAVAGVSAKSTKVIAKVNGVAITQDAYDQELKRVFPYFSMHGNKVPKEFEGDVRQKAIDNLVSAELMYQEAQRRNLKISPVEWNQRIAEIRKDYRTGAEFEAGVKQLFGSKQAFESKLRHDMLLDKLFIVEIRNKSVVTDAEVLKEFNRTRKQWAIPESASFQSISALFPANATPADKQAARKRIEALFAEAKSANTFEKFGLLAEKSSDDEYRVMMGEHKMVHKGALEAEFERVFSMKVGEISPIVESSHGYHILRLKKHDVARQLTFAEVRKDLKKSLQAERLRSRNTAFQGSLRKNAKVDIL